MAIIKLLTSINKAAAIYVSVNYPQQLLHNHHYRSKVKVSSVAKQALVVASQWPDLRKQCVTRLA